MKLRVIPMRLRRIILTLVVILPLLAVLAYGFFRDPRYIPSPIVGRPAPPFALTLYNGEKVSLSDLRGKVVFVNFWASWCPPCLAEAKELEATWRELKDRDVVFVGVQIQDAEANGRKFVEEFNITYPNGLDPSGRIAIDYGVWGIPESFFIDPEGRITYKHVGGVGPAVVAAKIGEARQKIVSAKEGKGEYQPIR
ncbi:MAG: TlpA family protein disulfide reductase [Candidatus Binatia bacterium]